jgi:probable DNA metabolism protein
MGDDMMKLTRIYVCEDSIDGIFTAIYAAWSSGYGHANIKLEEQCNSHNYSNIELFSEYLQVDTDYNFSLKVGKAIKEKISVEAYEMICRVALSDHIGKADLIYRFLILGFAAGPDIINHLCNEVVAGVFKISKFVGNEMHHLLGFVRFSEQENGLLTSIIHPKNNVLSLITPHFADRLPMERFIIYDETRNLASVHVPGKPWILVETQSLFQDGPGGLSYEEDEYQDLWKIFFKHITIKERINPKLQRNNLPLRFRGNMTEFNTTAGTR